MRYSSTTKWLILLTRYGLVGAMTTLFDLALFNLFSYYLLRLSVVQAHLCASLFTLCISFYGQRTWVFGSTSRNIGKQALRFFIITVSGVAMVQSAVLWGTKELFGLCIGRWGFLEVSPATAEVLIRNASKLSAMCLGICWNFLWFRTWVFRAPAAHNSDQTDPNV